MPEPERIIIVGTGLAGATAAAEVRERGFRGEVTLFGEQSHRPYELPALSKSVLLGETDEPEWVRDQGFYAEHDIDLRTSVRVERVDPAEHLITDDEGGNHRYDRLVLATGSRPRHVAVPGADLPGVRTLRTLDDALALRAALGEGVRVVVVGAGWIGTEAAAAARAHGADVTVVEQAELPLLPVLGGEVAAVFRDLHAEHGVKWRLGTAIAEFTGDSGGVRGVRLRDGQELAADLVLVAVGAGPRVELAEAAGLDLAADGGVAVDEGLAAAPDVFAAGDIASHPHPRYGHRVRVEHWANAKDQGAHVARNLLGENEPYLATPYFFTDQYDLGCEYRGLADPDADELVVRGDLASREFIAFWLREGRVRAALNVNSWDEGDALQALVDDRAAVSARQLREDDLGRFE
ncbi:NADPH-dependent 2,4-dienoyl-CoA reductase/sulfur reductase-like enzyme [Saccharomonospora amisosensis]|uniref:NADPH-dependent 2,4-dienoyl-CoA reductase/sulfur reductase-like enzyme n=1 Tax=Saccharomonospora amisosensis TaxID=1128677 RepID=A0A7X5ZRS3_9PSEU|nr:FAD-dependent oxidoreductase [Saccharomonospora amisosensis]NIJ13148.1 NADPH-dependent 2,4-dienoyl-CoA reductase/sulfur reductase-like enzyme [Saccharomonospora amisosensis]